MLQGIWRKGSLVWRAVLYTAFLAMGLFVTFDLLDLDGSQLESRTLPRGARAAVFISDAEDILFLDPSRLGPKLFDMSWQCLRAFDDAAKLSGKVRSTTATTRLDSVRRRPQFHTGLTLARPAAEDPY